MASNSFPKDNLASILLYGPIKMFRSTQFLIHTFAVNKCCPLKFRIDFCTIVIFIIELLNSCKKINICHALVLNVVELYNEKKLANIKNSFLENNFRRSAKVSINIKALINNNV